MITLPRLVFVMLLWLKIMWLREMVGVGISFNSLWSCNNLFSCHNDRTFQNDLEILMMMMWMQVYVVIMSWHMMWSRPGISFWERQVHQRRLFWFSSAFYKKVKVNNLSCSFFGQKRKVNKQWLVKCRSVIYRLQLDMIFRKNGTSLICKPVVWEVKIKNSWNFAWKKDDANGMWKHKT